MVRLLLVAVGGMALVACAGASKQVPGDPSKGTESASVKAAAEQDKKDQERMICTLERPTGSNIAERICRMPDEVDREREAAQDTMRELQRPGASTGD